MTEPRRDANYFAEWSRDDLIAEILAQDYQIAWWVGSRAKWNKRLAELEDENRALCEQLEIWGQK